MTLACTRCHARSCLCKALFHQVWSGSTSGPHTRADHVFVAFSCMRNRIFTSIEQSGLMQMETSFTNKLWQEYLRACLVLNFGSVLAVLTLLSIDQVNSAAIGLWTCGLTTCVLIYLARHRRKRFVGRYRGVHKTLAVMSPGPSVALLAGWIYLGYAYSLR